MSTISPRVDVSIPSRSAERAPIGLAAVPDAWIHAGASDVFVTSPWGGDHGTITRTQELVDIDLASTVSPDLQLQAAGEGRVKIVVKTPWPLPDIKAEGPMQYDESSATVQFRDERTPRTAEMWQSFDGQVHVVVHDPAQKDINIVLSTQGAQLEGRTLAT